MAADTVGHLTAKCLLFIVNMTILGYGEEMKPPLPWPPESAVPADAGQLRWASRGSNICLDFHGDPLTARLVVFSDGNHHMALEASLQAFRHAHPEVSDVFYATTPPGVLVNYLVAGQLSLGNLTLSRQPHVFISPPDILQSLQQTGFIDSQQPFMRSRGNVLLIRKGNPKHIIGIADIMRDDVRLFISNPETEKASYEVYAQTLLNLAQEASLDVTALTVRLADPAHTHIGEAIHHREAPQCLADNCADVALIYYHLALRYTRVFGDLFDFIPLGGDKKNPQPSNANLTTTYHIGLVGNGGDFGQALLDFMFDTRVTQIYAQHGLVSA